MRLPKVVRILFWTFGLLAAVTGTLYLLRWPLLGGLVRSKLSELAAEQLHSEVHFAHLGGSLLWSIHARDLALTPGPGSPFRSATITRMDVDYGFLGSGEPSVAVEGARLVLAPKEGQAPPLHETIRDVVSILRSLRFAGSVAATNVELVLPDGRSIALDHGELDHASWRASVRSAGFGTVDGSATLLSDGAMTVTGTATEGPVKSAKLDLGAGKEQGALRVTAEVLGHPLTWIGTAHFDQGRIGRIEGELSVKEGRAQTRVDLATGRVEADVNAVLAVDEELKGELSITVHGGGPLAGPKEEWTLREGRVKTIGARIRSLAVDEAEVALGPGSLSKISFKGFARVGVDRVDADGTFRWLEKPEVDASVRAGISDVAPYIALLKEPPPLKGRGIRADGRFRLKDGAASYDGSIESGAGAFDHLGWEAARIEGSVRPNRLEVRKGKVKESSLSGTPLAPDITASGTLEEGVVSLRFEAGGDVGVIGGRLGRDGSFEGRLRLEGPMVWLEPAFQITMAKSLRPVRLDGKISHEKNDTRVMLDLAAGSEVSMELSAIVRQQEGDWIVAVAPGTVALPKRRVDYDAFAFTITSGRASLENLRAACTEPEFAARVGGSATWDEKEIRVTFRMVDSVFSGVAIDPLFAKIDFARGTEEKTITLRWGNEEGDHLLVTGRVARELDLRAELRAIDLERPLVRRFLPGVELQGAIALDAHIAGTLSEPQAAGMLRVTNLTTLALPPLSLAVPFRTAKGRLRFSSVAEKTAYGSIKVEGSVPLPPAGEAPVDVDLQISTSDLSPILEKMSSQARAWIPPGTMTAEFSLHGPLSTPEPLCHLEFIAPRFRPPPPLAEATDLRVEARLDRNGIKIETAQGILGQGPFWASGRWDLFQPGRPFSLWITGWDALVVDDPLARIRVKPDVVLTWNEKHGVKLAGRVEVPLAIYHREFSAAAPGARAARTISSPRLRLVPGESGGFLIPGIEGLEKLEIDLKFVTTGEFRIENSVIGVLLHAEGQLTGTAGEPTVSGVVRTKERSGEVKLARGNFLRIYSGEAILPEEVGRAPTIRFQGGVGVGDGAIQVLVEGPLDNPSLVLRSDPPQPQNELLARLAFGVGQGAVSGETGVATLALYIYGQAQDNWPSADRREGFFDRIRPQVVPGESSQVKRMPWELPPTANMQSTSLRTEYVYNSYFSIIGETNREGDVAGDLKLRIRF